MQKKSKLDNFDQRAKQLVDINKYAVVTIVNWAKNAVAIIHLTKDDAITTEIIGHK